MKISRFKEMLAQMDEHEEIFVAWYKKEEAEEHIQENLSGGKQILLSDEQWLDIVLLLNEDESLWIDLDNSWLCHLENLYAKLEKEGVENVSSK